MKNDATTNDRIIYFDLLKIFAIFAVVMIHVASYFYSTDINTTEWNIYNFYDSISKWAVPVFVMVSGALFLRKAQTSEKIYKKNIVRLIIAFTFWSFVYAIFRFVNGGVSITEAISFFFEGHFHLWFIFMIIGLYMIVPLLQPIVKNDSLTKYFLILSLIFAFVIPQIASIVSYVSSDIGNVINSIFNNINIQFVQGFTFYFVLGYYLDQIKISKKATNVIYVLGICGFILTIALSIILVQATQKPDDLFHGCFSITVLLESLFIFVLFKNIFKDTKYLNIAKISRYIFGIYLIHPLVNTIIHKLISYDTLPVNGFIVAPILALVVFVCSFIACRIISKIPILNKYII